MSVEEKILSMLDGLITIVDQMQKGQTRMESDISVLMQGQAELKSDVAELKSDVAELKSDVGNLKQEQTRINIIIENEMLRDIRILAEGHMYIISKHDKIDELDERVTKIETDTRALKFASREALRVVK